MKNGFNADIYKPAIVNTLETTISNRLGRCGIYYKLFCRVKEQSSIDEKIQRKGYSRQENKLMQDIVGVRIVLYFVDDVEICKSIVESTFEIIGTSFSEVNENTFEPERINYVCELPEECLEYFDSNVWTEWPIDKTFEIQIRTIFSEGWHEIEHDVRYKSNTDWTKHKDLSRTLNGTLATLENCEWTILKILDCLSYEQYKQGSWAEMLKNKMRIRLADDSLDVELGKLINEKNDIAKLLFRIDRADFLKYLASDGVGRIPLTINNIIYIINLKYLQNEEILSITPLALKRILSAPKESALTH